MDISDRINTQQTVDNCIGLSVPYMSVWDGGTIIETTATVNIKTGEVTEVVVAKVDGLSVCEREYIVMNDEEVSVYQDERGYDLWADIKNELS